MIEYIMQHLQKQLFKINISAVMLEGDTLWLTDKGTEIIIICNEAKILGYNCWYDFSINVPVLNGLLFKIELADPRCFKKFLREIEKQFV